MIVASSQLGAGLWRRPRFASLVMLGSLPGLLLLLAYHWAATGDPGQAPQLSYYALADSPQSCFGYGTGHGCLGEHGDFIQRFQANGFHFREMVSGTWRRLFLHLRDAANLELLGVGAWLAMIIGARSPGVRVAATALGALVLAYAPFYFDGNLPGAGARFFMDAVVFEQLLIAWLLRQ